MNLLEKLNEQNLLEILKSAYSKVQESENISVLELIEEIKKQLMFYTHK